MSRQDTQEDEAQASKEIGHTLQSGPAPRPGLSEMRTLELYKTRTLC